MSAKQAGKGKGSGGGGSNSTLYIGLAVAAVVVAGGAWYMLGGEPEQTSVAPPQTVQPPMVDPQGNPTPNADRTPPDRRAGERAPIERPDRPEREPRATPGSGDVGSSPSRKPVAPPPRPRGKPSGKKFMD
ncbi:MAG: hypothetical protein JXB13_17735 [Phycisphaerae bacterium]|nr:hypothetical protein [Phycisphaerae bacterium]